MRNLNVYKIGKIDYQKALELQLSLVERRRRSEIEDTLLLLEHNHTFTMGKSGRIENLLVSLEYLNEKGIHFEVISRGGDITYHGPGQLVGYPIMSLEELNIDPITYLRKLEDAIIQSLLSFDIEAQRIESITGVWVKGEKVASIGIGVKKGITYHGFALNVNTNLSYFNMINPCGMSGENVTSMEKLLGRDVKMEEVEESIIKSFLKNFKIEHKRDEGIEQCLCL